MSKYKYNFELDTVNGHEDPFHDGRVVYTTVEVCGDTLEECLDNATVGRKDWHGNVFEHVYLGDLTSKLYEQVEREITERIGGG